MNDEYQKHVFVQADDKVKIVLASIPLDKVTPENEALVRAIAASVEF